MAYFFDGDLSLLAFPFAPLGRPISVIYVGVLLEDVCLTLNRAAQKLILSQTRDYNGFTKDDSRLSNTALVPKFDKLPVKR
jgi:hypothetical protein